MALANGCRWLWPARGRASRSAARVAWSASGVNLRVERPKPEQIAEAVSSVLTKPSYRDNTRRPAELDAIRVAPGVDDRRSRPGTLTQQIDPVVTERRTRGHHIVDLRCDAVTAKIKAAANEPIRAGPGSELGHVCAGGDLDGELGIEGLGETVEHPETRYCAASFKPSYG
jgi:hypothetical protein